MPDDVQPNEGQGGEATGTPTPLEADLQTVPEEYREHVAPILERWEKNVNGRLSEAADFRKQWEPFANVQEALSPYAQQPEVLSERLAWLDQVTADENAFDQWFEQVASEKGFERAAQEAQDLAETEPGPGELTKEQIEQLVAEKAAEQTQPLQEQLQQWEWEKAVDGSEAEIRSEWARLEAENDVTLSEDQKAIIVDLGINHGLDAQGNPIPGSDGWMQYGFDRFKSMTAEAQKAFVADKAKAPPAAVSAGGSERFKPAQNWEDAEARTKERWRQMQS